MLGLNSDLEILSTYCFYDLTIPSHLGSIGIGFVTNQGRFYYYCSSIGNYEFLMPIDVFYESVAFEWELYDPMTYGGISPLGSHYDLSEYALGDYSPPPPQENNKFDPIHLWWIIPSAVAVIGGGVFLGFYLIKRKKKSNE